jgi:phenylpyruvate tautomerase PptA (4-oxalocrotonate tautomerase family)
VPLIEIKAFDRRFEDPEAAARIVAAFTEVACEQFGEQVRDETWVVLDGVAPHHWGFGGKLRA